MPDTLLRMGVVGRPHGIKGELGLDWHGEAAPKAGEAIYLQAGAAEPRLWRVSGSRWHKGRLLLSLEGVADRTEAEALKGQIALMPRSSVPPPDEGEAFVADLPGCRVLQPDGKEIGVIDHVEFPAGRMIWAIRDGAGREILFPAEPEFIEDLDMDERAAIVSPPPGLLDIYSA